MAREYFEDQPREVVQRSFWYRARQVTYILIGLAFFIYFWIITEIDLREMFQPAPTFLRLVSDFLKIDLAPNVVAKVLQQMLVTIFQALLATTLGVADCAAV